MSSQAHVVEISYNQAFDLVVAFYQQFPTASQKAEAFEGMSAGELTTYISAFGMVCNFAENSGVLAIAIMARVHGVVPQLVSAKLA